MADDLLLELGTAVPAAKSLENIEDLVRVLVRQIGEAVEDLKGSARAFENIWQSIVVEVARGRTAEMQAVLPRLQDWFETRLKQLKHIQVLMISLSALGKMSLPDTNALWPEIEGMERLKTHVFDRWQSATDLEKLAVEHFPLAQSQLEQIAVAHAPPAEWYQGEEERLFQE